jgi:hypothetical protein
MRRVQPGEEVTMRAGRSCSTDGGIAPARATHRRGPAWPDATDARACVSSPGFLPRGTHTVIAQRGRCVSPPPKRPIGRDQSRTERPARSHRRVLKYASRASTRNPSREEEEYPVASSAPRPRSRPCHRRRRVATATGVERSHACHILELGKGADRTPRYCEARGIEPREEKAGT